MVGDDDSDKSGNWRKKRKKREGERSEETNVILRSMATGIYFPAITGNAGKDAKYRYFILVYSDSQIKFYNVRE